MAKKDIDIHFGNDSPLYMACRREHVEIAKLLIQNGANMHARDYLSSAIEDDAVEILELLINNGIDIHENVLAYAAGVNSIKTVKFLLEKGFAITGDYILCDEDGGFPDNIEIVKLLLEYGVDVHFQNDMALRSAFKTDKAELVKLFIKYGTDPTVLYEEFRNRFACIAALPPQNIP